MITSHDASKPGRSPRGEMYMRLLGSQALLPQLAQHVLKPSGGSRSRLSTCDSRRNAWQLPDRAIAVIAAQWRRCKPAYWAVSSGRWCRAPPLADRVHQAEPEPVSRDMSVRDVAVIASTAVARVDCTCLFTAHKANRTQGTRPRVDSAHITKRLNVPPVDDGLQLPPNPAQARPVLRRTRCRTARSRTGSVLA